MSPTIPRSAFTFQDMGRVIPYKPVLLLTQWLAYAYKETHCSSYSISISGCVEALIYITYFHKWHSQFRAWLQSAAD